MSEFKTLPTLIREASEIVQILLENGGELPAELEVDRDTNLAALGAKADGYAFIMDELETRAAFLRSRAEVYLAAAKSCENAVESMSNRMLWALEALGEKEIAGQETRFVLTLNPPKTVVEDESKIPAIYYVSEVVTKLDKKKLAEDLKSGTEIAGAKLERGMRCARKIVSAAPKKKVVANV